jgi:lipoprotein-releasing system ATP-binding protein
MSIAVKKVISAQNIHKSYKMGPNKVAVLKGLDMDVYAGELLAIIGQSGSGKSTMLHLLGTLDKPDSGEIYFEGNRIDNLKPRSRDFLRNRYFGFIFQFYHLLPELTTLENVLVPILIRYNNWFAYRLKRRQYVERAKELLDTVGLSHRLNHKPRELSGGEMQRAAIARALIADPKLLLADEPTGNLDRETGEGILEVLRRLNAERGLSIIMVTHDPAIAAGADRTVNLVGGRVHNANQAAA